MARNDDGDDPLDNRSAELEARFRELEHEAEIERLRAHAGGKAPRAERSEQRQPGTASPAAGEARDPLADLKAAVDGASEPTEAERYLLVECPHCQAKNRMSLSRVRTATPVCGRCKQGLAVPR
jgi:hypothetical protein